jgi:hypothetical protein
LEVVVALESLLSELYRAAAASEPPFLRPFVTTSFGALLRECPGLARRLFGDLIPLSADLPPVAMNVPSTVDVHLDIVIEGDGGAHLLIENRLAPDLEWYEERSPHQPPTRLDSYIVASRQRYARRGRVLILARTESGGRLSRKHPPDLFAGVRTWSSIYRDLEEARQGTPEVPAFLILQFLRLLKEHDMNPSEPISPRDAETIHAFDQYARNCLKLLEEAVGRIRQEFDLRSVPNNRRLTGWYACSDRFQSDELHLFFYLMFPPIAELVVRPAIQVTKESSHRGLAAAAEHGFRKGRWGSLWIERDFSRQSPFLALPVERQVEELVRFFQSPLSRLSKAGLVKLAPARAAEPASHAGAPGRDSAPAPTDTSTESSGRSGGRAGPAPEPASPAPSPAREEAPAPAGTAENDRAAEASGSAAGETADVGTAESGAKGGTD